MIRAATQLILMFLSVVAVALPLAAQAGVIQAWSQTEIGDSTAAIRSKLTMMYISTDTCHTSDCVLGMTGTHQIKSANGTTVREISFNVPNTYRGSMSYAGAQNQCYFTRGHAAYNYYNPPYGSTGPVIITSTEEIGYQVCVAPILTACMPGQSDCESTPIIISLRGDYHLTSVLDGVRFDIDADGAADRVSWTAPGAALAFLALDRNGNGVVDDGSELFGNHTPLASGQGAGNGWDALAELDANGDRLITMGDPVWSDLLLWVDTNHDGASDSNELTPVESSVIRGIPVDYKLVGRRDPLGNLFRFEGQVLLQYGRRAAYDVVLMQAD